MTQNSLISVIEGLLEGTLTEAEQNKVNSKNQVDKQEKQKTSPDTQGVLGKEKGAALDGGADKDVGGSKGDNASDASASVEADKGPHGQAGDEMETKSKLKEEEEVEDENLPTEDEMKKHQKNSQNENADADEDDEMKEEAAQEPSNAKNQVDKQEKQKTSPKAEADKGPHDTSNEGLKEAAEEESDDEEESEEVELTLTLDKKELMAAVEDAGAVEEAKELTDKQKKLDVDKDGDIGSDDLADLRKEEAEDMDDEDEEESDDEEEKDEVEENAFDYKSPRPVQPNGGAGKKQGHRYGGSKQKNEEAEDDKEDGLEEDFKEKATIIFETAVNEKARMIREQVEAEFNDKLQAEKARINEQVAEFVDAAVQEWLKENKLEIKYSLRTEIAENFIGGLKTLFAENYIEIPDEDVSVVDELTEAVESYKEQLEEQAQALEEAQAIVLEFKRKEIIDEITEDLTETQKIRLEKLSESVEAGDIDEFRYKTEQLKESFFSGVSEQPHLGSLSEEVFGGHSALEEDTSPVSQYAKFLSKTVFK